MPTERPLQHAALHAPPAWSVRAYGAMLDDLAVDPLDGPLPLAAARVLSACVAAAEGPAAEPLGWPVNLRLQGLLAVTIATCGPDWIWSAHCPHGDCAAAMDLPLQLDDFRVDTVAEQVECALTDGRRLTVSLPTGRDQLAWLGEVTDDLLVRLVGEDRLTTDDREAIENALEAADPLRTLEIETDCPECAREVTLALDLEAACLARLAGRRPQMLDEIHVLASAYHWSEREIMAMPPSRRSEYLVRIERAWA